MAARTPLKLVPLGDASAFLDRQALAPDDTPLADLLRDAPAVATTPLDAAAVALPLRRFFIQVLASVPPNQEVFLPAGVKFRLAGAAPAANGTPPPPTTTAAVPPPDSPPPPPPGHPEKLTEREPVTLAYGPEVAACASYLKTGLSVLVVCDKLVVPHLWDAIPAAVPKSRVLLDVPAADAGDMLGRSLRQRQLAKLKELIDALPPGDVLVVPHLDLLAGGTDGNLAAEARELVELLYHVRDGTRNAREPLLLAFADPSLTIPEVLAARFAVRYQITGVPREVATGGAPPRPLGQALVTAAEAARFDGYNADEVYKNVAGMNPVRFRQAIAYAVNEAQTRAGKSTVKDLYRSIRAFKKQTSANFEVPNVRFDQIGGYAAVKAELLQALKLMTGAFNLPDGMPADFQRELIPRGFLFYGPPGTGKTLFAKAVANFLNATIQVVSGPEVTDMYVGESERKLREIFAEARRNAPAVVVFDEFDSIATKRSGRDDGGSRAGNAIVAQILTEMDGFRPDVPMLVIGTTNRLDIIDEALLRPSRFRPVPIDLPDEEARRAIAGIHAAHFRVPTPPGLLDVVAHATEGLNGDEIRAVFRDACVGMFCQQPAVPPTPYRLGFLVGQLREARQRRDREAAANRPAAARRPADAGRPAPAAETWVTLTPPTNAPEAPT